MKIFFDFDHTLFDMASMHDAIRDAMEDLGIEKKQYDQIYEDVTRWKLFSVEDLAVKVEKIADIPKEKVVAVFEKLAKESALFVFDDVEPACRKLKELGHELYLLSWGDDAWQRKKISHSGIDSLFEHVLTSHGPKSEGLDGHYESGEQVVFVDDKPVDLRDIKDYHPEVHLIRIRRPGAKYSDQETPEGIQEAENMQEVVELIQEYVRNHRV